MSIQEKMKCDLCGEVEETNKKHSRSSLHIRPKIAYRLFWWNGGHDRSEFDETLDICDKCIQLFHDIRHGRIAEKIDKLIRQSLPTGADADTESFEWKKTDFHLMMENLKQLFAAPSKNI